MGNHDIPPPPLATDARPGRTQQKLAALSALLLGALGWIIWFVALGVERDAGYPDGLACTAWAKRSTEYTSCMLGEERGGAIAWAVSFALAAIGLTMTIRARFVRGRGGASWPLAFAGMLMPASLALAAATTMALGVSGGFYEDRVGPAFWLAAAAIGFSAGASLGWLFTRRGDLK